MEALNEFFNAVDAEQKRVSEVLQMQTWNGMMKARKIYAAHFNTPVEHGMNVLYDIARVNVIRRNENREGLC